MAKLASEVVRVCNEWLGKNEADGSFKVIIDTYNSYSKPARNYKMKYSDEWCSCFVSAVAIKLGYTDIIPIEVGCEKHVALFKEKGIWIENDAHTPKIGDIVLYDWDDDNKGDNTGWSDHIGYVVGVGNGTFTVIEGNYSCRVAKRTMAINGRFIRGFASPKYDAEPTKEESKEVTPLDDLTDVQLACMVWQGKFGNGADRKAKLGDRYSEVQYLVSKGVGQSNNSSATLKALADEVMRGLWGNGAKRKENLTKNGFDCDAVQKIVNSRY